MTALQLAAEAGHTRMMQLLLEICTSHCGGPLRRSVESSTTLEIANRPCEIAFVRGMEVHELLKLGLSPRNEAEAHHRRPDRRIVISQFNTRSQRVTHREGDGADALMPTRRMHAPAGAAGRACVVRGARQRRRRSEGTQRQCGFCSRRRSSLPPGGSGWWWTHWSDASRRRGGRRRSTRLVRCGKTLQPRPWPSPVASHYHQPPLLCSPPPT